MTRVIPGALAWTTLATMHRPTDPRAIEAEARRLHRDHGLTARDVGEALRIDPTVAHEALASDSEAHRHVP